MKTKEAPDRTNPKANQDVNSDKGCNPQILLAEAYWALWRGGNDSQIRLDWNIPPRERPPLPHEGLCLLGFDSPAELLADLLSKGWKKDSFDGTANRFARIETTATGLVVTSFETYQAACRAHGLSTR